MRIAITGLVRLLLPAAFLAGMFCFINGCSHAPAGPAADDHIPWRTDYDAALAEGKTAGKPILIDFSATWCPPCQQMKRASWPDARVADLAATKYIPLALDADSAGAKAPGERYGIDTIPAILIVDSDGKVIRQSGYMNADDLVAFLNQK
jgi:thiol:disulfide interchange protein